MDHRRNIILLILLILAVFLSFLPSLWNGFTNYDDDAYVTENTLITDISPRSIQNIFSSATLGLYKPLVMLSFALERHFFGLSPFAYHFTNLILHLLNSLLVFWMIYLVSGSSVAAFITALFFGLHPMHVESVAWVSERKDVLYSFFFLQAAVCYLYYRRKESKSWYYLSLIAFLFSLLAKPVALVFPFVMLAFDFLQKRKMDKDVLIEKLPFFLPSGIFIVINLYAQYFDPNPRPQPSLNLLQAFFTANYCIIFYLEKLFFPVRLSCVYAYPQKISGYYPAFYYLCSLMVIAAAAFIYMFRKRGRILVFGAVFFLITLLPALRIVPIFTGIAADRYTYIPYIGIFYIIGTGAAFIYGHKGRSGAVLKTAMTIILICAGIVLSSLTYNRTKVWKDGFSLWADVLKNYPREPFAYYSRALLYLKQNDPAAAMSNFNKAIEFRPDFVEARINRAVIYSRQGDFDRAIAEYGLILSYSPRCFEAYNNRGNLYGRQSRFNEAISDFNEAIKINPFYSAAYYNRAITYMALKDYPRCLEDLHRAQDLGLQVDTNIINEVVRSLR